ncbi:alpha/beta fold hydrolase [Nonomuraea aridisoli]|uniref:Alpha/beta hydrolase n=1 Tax=Nonomuraea aridisoli TaxID=2070368 RepID=A0A2W2ES43_9ACTN|nr:alpha/beta fold hydrolase [Nonomuraea aridisoli]PZG16350.1 alpha/beta hydrolase [Nonomuraea aridisoli]
MELAFERRGSGEPLILVHGIGHHRRTWLPVLDRLAAARTVIAVDLPGFGASAGLPEPIPYTAESLADAVESFCVRLGVREPHVAGHSLGGYIALELASRGVVRTATALSPVGFWTRPELLYYRTVLRAMRASARYGGFAPTLESFGGLMPPGPPKSPVTIAWGEHDRLLPRRQAVRAARWSGQRVKLLKGCGHVPMSDDPELVARVILEE